MGKRPRCRYRAKIPLYRSSFSREDIALASSASFLPPPPITYLTSPHPRCANVGLDRSAAPKLIYYCFLIYNCAILCYFSLRPATAVCFALAHRAPLTTRQRHWETSPAWRSQLRLTPVLTSPRRVYLPGGASSPALYIPHLPLPSPREHSKLAILTAASTSTFPPLCATL